MKIACKIVLLLLFIGFTNGSNVRAQACCDEAFSTADYCLTGSDGLFMCISTAIPDGFGCSACVASTCHHFHLRNVSFCDGIDKIVIDVTKDGGSSEYQICKPVKNFGLTPTTAEWTVTDESTAGVTTGDCIAWNASTSHSFTFLPPAAGYNIDDLNHWDVTICGGSAYTIHIFYSGVECPNTFSPTITSATCPPEPCP